MNVHTRYIAEVKRMCGLDMGENYNKSKKDNPEVKHCPHILLNLSRCMLKNSIQIKR